MNRFTRSTTGLVTGCLVMVVAAAASAVAQDQAGGVQPPPAPGQGPLVVQPISSGFVLMPEVRFTELNHSWGTQIGVSGGWLYDDTFFLGGGFYGLVGGADDQQLTYGGFITGWSAPINSALRVGVRALFGWGSSETFEQWTDPGYCHRGTCYGATTQQAWVFQDFLVFEPAVNATIRLARQVSLDISGGYRLTGNSYYGWDSHVNGAFGSVGVRFGLF
jgi:hypothetical protein